MSGQLLRNKLSPDTSKLTVSVLRKITSSIIIILVILGTLIAVIPARGDGWTTNPWIKYNINATSIVEYDFDHDGTPEVVVLPDYAIDNFVEISSPYPKLPNATLVDISGDGRLDLVLYAPNSGLYLVYNGTRQLGKYQLPVGTPLVNTERTAVAVGNTVLYHLKLYRFNQTSDVYPVSGGSKLFVLYKKDGKLYVSDVDGNSKLVYPDNITIIGASERLGVINILGKSPLGGTLFISYDTNSNTTKISGFTTEIDKVWMYDDYYDAFIASYKDNVYEVSKDKILLIYKGTPIGSMEGDIFIYKDGKVYIYDPTTRSVDWEITLPINEKPEMFSAQYPYVSLTYGNGTVYVLSTKPTIGFDFYYPQKVMVGEPFKYKLLVDEGLDASVLLDGKEVPVTGTATVKTVGKHEFTVYVTNGVVTVEKNYTFEATPRPIDILLYSNDTPLAFSDFNMTVRTYDGVNGNEVVTTCTITTPTDNISTESWKFFNIKLEPVDNNGTIPIKVVCGGNTYYKKTVHTDSITLKPVPPKLRLEYLGKGVIKILLESPDSTVQATGTGQLYIDGNYITQEPLPITITNMTEGNHTIILKYIPDTPIFEPTIYNLTVTYYANSINVPPEYREHVITADVVKTINQTRTITETVTKTQTKTTTQYKKIEVPTLDEKNGIIILTIGLIAGLSIGYVYATIRNRPKPEIDNYKPSSQTSSENSDVELEKL